MVRWEFFSHLPMKVFRDPECRNVEMEKNHTHKYAGNSFSRCFTSVPEILGWDFSPKNGVQNSSMLISGKELDQIKREWTLFVSAEPLLLAVFSSFLKSA